VYSAKTDLVDTVLAEHVNLLQDEVTATQSTLGTGVLSSTWSGTFTNPSSHVSIAARLLNIEAGVVSAQSAAASKARLYAQTSQPSAMTSEDFWADTSVGI
jgi:hypothetical protein